MYNLDIVWYKVNREFTLPVSYIHMLPLQMTMDIAISHDESLFFKENEIFGHSIIKVIDESVNICVYKGAMYPIGLDTEFFRINTTIFTDVTTQVKRDFKLDKLI